jgi:hypothetical protein
MIKKSIFTLMFLAVIGFVSAQSIQFELNGNVINEGEAIECTTVNEWGEYFQDMQLRNLTSDDLDIMVEKEVLENLEGTMNWFCWGLCFSPDVLVSPSPVTVAANSVTDESALSFHAMFNDDVFGYVVVKYSAYVERHPEERISIIVKFHKSGEGVDDNLSSMEMSQAYPNPASSVVNFDYNCNGDLTAVVYNIVGQEVLRQDLNSNFGQMNFSVADLNDGIYFCTMMVNGRALATQKFIVKK